MPRERTFSEVKEPHLISLKVLRLSRPSLSDQLTVPIDTLSEKTPELRAAAHSSHAYPSHLPDDNFTITPLLTLPPAFGSVYIGETFSCCLSSANETLAPVCSVRVSAEMQTPSNPGGIALLTDDAAFDLPASGAHQRIVSYDLKEEGAHVLAVTLTYAPVPGSQRTFKKLYQFAAQQCIMVRTKAGVLGGGRAVLEAQLENLGEAPVMLDRVGLKSEWRWWGMGGERLVLRPREVVQVGFVLEWDGDGERPELGLLSIVWKTAGGERGFLRTGKLVLPGAA